MDLSERYDRNIRLFGVKGQEKISRTKVVIGGASGLGSPLALHLALLGVAKITIFDPEELDDTNRNRLVSAREEDSVPGSLKVHLAHRMVTDVNKAVECVPLPLDLITPEVFDAVKAADWVFGCFDDDGPRAVLNELSAAYEKPYIDMAADVPEKGRYGGHVMVAKGGHGCLHCMGEIDAQSVTRFLMSEQERMERDRVYGIDRAVLGQKGPSVSPLNGVIASLAALEFMVAVTGLREPKFFQKFFGEVPALRSSNDKPSPDCPICKGTWGKGADVDIDRYLRLRQAQKGR